MKPVTIALTGGSSFTGLWIAKTLCDKGFKVHVLCGSRENSYEGMVRRRVQELKKTTASIHFNIRAEDHSMINWIEEFKPDYWIHHHHYMKDYRSESYDLQECKRIAIVPLPEILEALKKNFCQGVIFSGSYFEPGEGGNSKDLKATPYSVSKKWVWEEIKKLCGELKIPISKIVIPNPIGPFENLDRLIPIFIQKTKKGEPLSVAFPQAIQDHLPALWLGKVYFKAIVDHQKGRVLNYRPSGMIAENRIWMNEIQSQLLAKNLHLPVIPIQFSEIHSQKTAAPPNYKNNPEEKMDEGWELFWKEYAVFLNSEK